MHTSFTGSRWGRLTAAAVISSSVLVASTSTDVSARLEPTELRSVEDTTYVTEFDITYNPDDDEYLAVWRRVGNSGIGDIAGVTLDAAGTPMGSPVVVASATTLGEAFRDAGRWDPDVEYNPVTKEYLLVLLRDTGLVSGQRIDTTGRPVGSEIELTTLG